MEQLSNGELIMLLILTLWVIPWKIYSLWIAAKNNHKLWFVAIIALNTVGILEIFYIFGIAKKKWSDIKSTLQQKVTLKK